MIGLIRQETLSGIKAVTKYEQNRRDLRAYDDEPLTTDDFEAAAKAFNQCRSQGVLGSHGDFLICAVAIRRGWTVFTSDPDFVRYAKILSLPLHKTR